MPCRNAPDFGDHSVAVAEVGRRLRLAREAAGMSQSDLRAASGVTTATISRLESGLQDARMSTLLKLAVALHVADLAELVVLVKPTLGT